MPFYRESRTLPGRFRLILASFLQRRGLPFADALPEEAIQNAFDDEDASFADEEDAVYTPAVTLWAFLSQVLFKDEQRSCVAAVARVVVLLAALERGPCSNNTGAYCRARGKLSKKKGTGTAGRDCGCLSLFFPMATNGHSGRVAGRSQSPFGQVGAGAWGRAP